MDNPPAFPLGVPHMTEYQPEWGMTLLDYFAAKALAGLMANANMPFAPDYAECEPSQIAEASYEIADAMLAARPVPSEQGCGS